MTFLDTLRKLSSKLGQSKDSLFSYPVEAQQNYIAHFPEPKDDIERSYFQYCCQMRLSGRVTAIWLNLASLPLALFLCFRYRKNEIPQLQLGVDAVFTLDRRDLLSESLLKRFHNIQCHPLSECLLVGEDLKYLKCIWKRYPLSFHFLLKSIIKIANYRYQTEKLQPKAIIASSEYSFTSSLLTDWCSCHGIEHINVMHGEKLYYMRDSFFHFHQCYIWDDYYRGLFTSMRAEASQFHIAVPPALILSQAEPPEKTVDYTYYLAAETEAQLDSISKCMTQLSKAGYRVAIRPHPLHPISVKDNYLFAQCEIESEIPIEQSLLRTRNAISLYSTVLGQAAHNGVGVVVDDVTSPERYQKLYELGYKIIMQEHMRLSQILNNTQGSC